MNPTDDEIDLACDMLKTSNMLTYIAEAVLEENENNKTEASDFEWMAKRLRIRASELLGMSNHE